MTLPVKTEERVGPIQKIRNVLDSARSSYHNSEQWRAEGPNPYDDNAPTYDDLIEEALSEAEAINAELVTALQMAMPALEWCEEQWADSQQHEGISVMAVVRHVLSKAEPPQ